MKNCNAVVMLVVVFLLSICNMVQADFSKYKIDSSEVYRSDVIRELKRLADNQEIYHAKYDTYTDDLSVIGLESVRQPWGGSFVWPEMSFEIIHADNESYIIMGTHSKVDGISWTYSVDHMSCEAEFRQNGDVYNPEMEVFELYRGELLEKLKGVFRDQATYKAEYDIYFSSIPYYECSRKWNPGITLRLAVSDQDYFLVEGEHSKIKGYSWSLDSEGRIKTIALPLLQSLTGIAIDY